MLNLATDTDPSWVERVKGDVPTLLLDHAHCEKKAASTAFNLIFRYQTRAELVRPLTGIAMEELEHFQQMLDILDDRAIPFEVLSPSPYAGRLFKAVRHGEPERFLDTLLVLSLIEARSCERMKLLSETLEDPELRALYKGLLASEARHHHSYVDLAMRTCGREATRARLRELAAHEAEVLADAPDAVRMHN